MTKPLLPLNLKSPNCWSPYFVRVTAIAYTDQGLFQAGGVPVLVAMAGPGTPWAQEAAARALRNLSFHEPVRPVLCEAGAIQQLSALLECSTPRASDAASAALRNLQPQSDGPTQPPV